MEVRKICQWCGKPFIAKKTTTCYCSHQCSNLGYKERIRERKRQMRKMQELLQPKQAAEGQDFFSFAQAARLMGVTRQYVYKLVKESKLRASRISGKKSLIRRADIELMLKTKPYERIIPKDDFDMSEYYTAEEIAEKYKVNAKWVWTYTRQHKIPKVKVRQFNYYSKKGICQIQDGRCPDRMVHSRRNREKLWNDTCSHPLSCLSQQHTLEERTRTDILLQTSFRPVQADRRRGFIGILHRAGSHEEIQPHTGFGLRHPAIPRNQTGEERPVRAFPESGI